MVDLVPKPSGYREEVGLSVLVCHGRVCGGCNLCECFSNLEVCVAQVVGQEGGSDQGDYNQATTPLPRSSAATEPNSKINIRRSPLTAPQNNGRAE